MDRELLVSGRQQRLEEGEGDRDGWHRGARTRVPGKETEGCGGWLGRGHAGEWQPEGVRNDSVSP